MNLDSAPALIIDNIGSSIGSALGGYNGAPNNIGAPSPLGSTANGGVYVAPVKMGESVYEGGGDNQLYDAFEGYNNFLGIAIGKKAKENKQKKIETKQIKKKIQLDNKASRGYARRSKADARMALADQGIVTPDASTGIGQALTSAGGIVASFMGAKGGGGSQPAYTPSIGGGVFNPGETLGSEQTETTLEAGAGKGAGKNRMAGNTNDAGQEDPKEKKNKNLPYIIAGAVVALLVIVMVFKKK